MEVWVAMNKCSTHFWVAVKKGKETLVLHLLSYTCFWHLRHTSPPSIQHSTHLSHIPHPATYSTSYSLYPTLIVHPAPSPRLRGCIKNVEVLHTLYVLLKVANTLYHFSRQAHFPLCHFPNIPHVLYPILLSFIHLPAFQSIYPFNYLSNHSSMSIPLSLTFSSPSFSPSIHPSIHPLPLLISFSLSYILLWCI